jgi:hypothetical protein
VPAGLEADGVDRRVDLGDAEDLLDLVLRVALGDVDRLAPERARRSRRSGIRSATITTAAPRNCAECAAARPTGPAPAM